MTDSGRKQAKALAVGALLLGAWVGLLRLGRSVFPDSPQLVYALTGLVFWILLYRFCINPLVRARGKRQQ